MHTENGVEKRFYPVFGENLEWCGLFARCLASTDGDVVFVETETEVVS